MCTDCSEVSDIDIDPKVVDANASAKSNLMELFLVTRHFLQV